MSRRPDPPRPIAVWAATVVVSMHCGAVPVWWLYHLPRVGLSPLELFVAVLSTLTAVAVFGWQLVAVFGRRRTGAWVPAAAVGALFLLAGGHCFFTAPLTLLAGNTPATTYPKPYMAAWTGLWGAAGLATGAVMLWWARALYRARARRWVPLPPPPPPNDDD